MSQMEEEIRESAGDAMNENISDVPGNRSYPDPDSSTGGSSGSQRIPGQLSEEEKQQRAEQFPPASESETLEAAERAKASFGGTAGGGGGVESKADTGVATGGGAPPAGDAGSLEQPAGNTLSEGGETDVTEGATTGQKFAAILGSDPNLKAEAKIADKLSGSGKDE